MKKNRRDDQMKKKKRRIKEISPETPWEKMDEYDVCRLKYEQCQYCKYFLIQNTKAIGMGTCDYIGKTGHMRGCTPLQCKEKGIFVKAKGKKNGKRKEKCLED